MMRSSERSTGHEHARRYEDCLYAYIEYFEDIETACVSDVDGQRSLRLRDKCAREDSTGT